MDQEKKGTNKAEIVECERCQNSFALVYVEPPEPEWSLMICCPTCGNKIKAVKAEESLIAIISFP
jgi:hypothetical protein